MIRTTLPEPCSESWQRIVHGVRDKRGLVTSYPDQYASHDTSLMLLPNPTEEPTCYATKAAKGPIGVVQTMDIVGWPKQRVSLPGLQMICAAAGDMPDFQTFFKDTTSDREVGGNDILGVIISSLAQNFTPVLFS